MKKLALVLTSLAIASALVYVGTVETHYTMKGYVVENGMVRLENGECYEFVDDSIHTGDKLKVYMYNNGTDTNLYDDSIVSYQIIR